MLNNLLVFNIRRYLVTTKDKELGEEKLKEILSEFSCYKNPDVERFLKEQAITFTKKNQSVTYLVFSRDAKTLLGYFTLAIKPISINVKWFSNAMKKKMARVSNKNKENDTYTLAAYLIAQLGKNFSNHINESVKGADLLRAALDTIKETQYKVGGMVVFLESDDDANLMQFYEQESGFKRFDVREVFSKNDEVHSLVQLLKLL